MSKKVSSRISTIQKELNFADQKSADQIAFGLVCAYPESKVLTYKIKNGGYKVLVLSDG